MRSAKCLADCPKFHYQDTAAATLFANVGRDHLCDLPFPVLPEAKAVHSSIVRDDRQPASSQASRKVAIKFSGMPHRPKPPDITDMPSNVRPARGGGI
jgi:hypothetical protein